MYVLVQDRNMSVEEWRYRMWAWLAGDGRCGQCWKPLSAAGAIVSYSRGGGLKPVCSITCARRYHR